ncbi:MAG: M13 family metallopeptidase, partial [Alcanivoracaceae bacterium]|nr:M13 family metallopeptidase [Alcanivoracaceae bacterium]
KMTFADFNAKVPSINWQAWLKHTMLTKPEVVVIEQPSYFETINKVMQDTSIESWKDYFKWHLLSRRANSLSSSFDQENFAFFGTVLSGTTEQEPRWKRAVNLVNNAAGELVGRVYVKKHFKPEAKTRMVNMVEILRDAYADRIKNLAWMSAEAKVYTLDRIAKFDIKIGYPEVWRDFSKMEINSTDLMANRIEITRFYVHRSRSRLGKPINRSHWDTDPQSATALSTPAKNQILFPAGYLQAPFFNLNADAAINYGAIGAIIGHEIGHGFGYQGLNHDADGNKKNGWTKEDIIQYKERTEKLKKQFDAYTVVDGTHVNGEFTQAENIADQIGLSIAYKAFKANYKGNAIIDGYTPEQRFFLGWGQIWMNKYRDEELLRQIETNIHSPPEFRTNGILRNLPEFYQAFDVKPGDGMYLPEQERVKIL